MLRARPGLRAVLALALVTMFVVPSTIAKTRVMRILDWRSGLPASYISNIEQDPEGFLWISSVAGVFRYDGAEMLRQSGREFSLLPGSASAGEPILARWTGKSHDILSLQGDPMPGQNGNPLMAVAGRVGADGALWVVDGDFLSRRTPDGAWSGPFRLPPCEDSRSILDSGSHGSILLSRRDGVYRVEAGGRVELVASLRGAIHAIDRADGTTVVGTFLVEEGGRVYEVRAGIAIEIDRGPRLMDLAERNGVLWVAYDRELARIAGGEPRETITLSDGLPSGGALLVDREGSLWVATFRGLVQFPEPETVSWQGEAPASGRHVVESHGEVWMSSWAGLFRARFGDSGWALEREPSAHVNAPCVDASGAVWTATGEGFRAISPDGSAWISRTPTIGDAERCSATADGGLWLPTSAGLYLLDPGSRAPRLVLPTGSDGAYFPQFVLEDSRGTLWGSAEGTICSTPAAELRAGRPAPWSCLPVADGRLIHGLAEMPGGAIWATTFGAGVWRGSAEGWEPIPGAAELESGWTQGISASPSGGVWITGEGVFIRVRERTDLAAGWEILERIGVWQGLPTSGVADVVESSDGTLWAATNASLLRMPPGARRARPAPPPVALVEATVDGQRLEAGRGRTIELPYRRNRLELRFAALSYREPGLIRYRSRLHSTDEWSPPTKQPFFRFLDLPSGGYSVEVEASLDGQQWSRPAEGVALVVLLPWYRTWWFALMVIGALATILLLAYRLRVASLLRLERQRMRIAMDLHDEVGSGLGSIGVLAGILARPELPAQQRADISVRITGVARELSQSLGDIVWSLRAGSGSLDALWAKIIDRAQPLFAGDKPVLQIETQEPIPDLPLSLATRRNASLIAIEALHNAARHSDATTVRLALEARGEEILIVIADDGRGIQETSRSDVIRRGLGLEGMRTRAAEMGGSVDWERPAAGGTRVVLRFRPGPRP